MGRRYCIQIVDRVGGGDAFSAALIYARLRQFSCREAVEFATAASCLKHTIEHDYNLISVHEVSNLVNGDAFGRFQR
ncbi:MAG TPA: PfkB family carbohydrate kinase [Armatimonadota bacterium]|nr:PfkB family carbohydrate kinase [Armatimonadota bacterium]